MRYRKLGTTGLKVSEIGFGTWGIGGVGEGWVAYGPTDDHESRAALERAFACGMTFYDTADLYGHGHSERLLGDVFKPLRKDVVIASKVGLLDQRGSKDFSPGHIRASLEDSLRRLRTDYLDLYQLHDPPMDLLENRPDVLDVLRALEREGKIRAWGVSVQSPGEAFDLITRWGIRCVQINFNMLDQRALTLGLLGLCESEGVGVIVRTPLCFGFLTGYYSEKTCFEGGDHRVLWSRQQRERWAQGSQIFASVRKDTDESMAQFALRYCLSYPGVSTVIPGMLTETEVEEDAAVSERGPLSAEERRKIEEVYQEHSFFVEREELRR
ncbi:MAG: aldo/keto reductase [Candidatus Omnitrophica bacterium]|nr:aldo/keto reductase [Candidatus Omnitrophota bacterium]